MIAARAKKRRGPLRDRAYLAWIRGLTCVVCARVLGLPPIGTWRATEAAHVGVRGIGQKCSDRETIPLCALHHRLGRYAHHRLGKKFWEVHQLDRDALIADLNARYEEARATR